MSVPRKICLPLFEYYYCMLRPYMTKILKATQCNAWVEEMTELWNCCHSWPFFFHEICPASVPICPCWNPDERVESAHYLGVFSSSHPPLQCLFLLQILLLTMSSQGFWPHCLLWHWIWIWFLQESCKRHLCCDLIILFNKVIYVSPGGPWR